MNQFNDVPPKDKNKKIYLTDPIDMGEPETEFKV